jgi:hypothetical protein
MHAPAVRGGGISGFRSVLCRPKAVALAGLLAMVLAGCKTSGTVDTVQTGTAGTPTQAAPASNIIGTGPVAIAIFTDSMGAPKLAMDHRDGAALAVNQLAKDQITLTVYDAGPNGADIGADVQAAMAAGAKLLIGPPSLVTSPIWAKADPAKRPPAILLATAPAKPAANSFWIVSSETDSAAEIAAYAVSAGKKQVLIAAPAPLLPPEIAQVKAAVEAPGGTFLGVVTLPSPAIKPDLIDRADAVVLYGPTPETVLAPLRQAGIRTDAWVLGTSEWTSSAYVDGAYFASIDQSGFRHISGGFKTAYGRGLSSDAAYAFDAIAVAAGIIRAKGVGSMSAAELKSATGFSGASGLFRFKPDGRVERRFAVYKVTGKTAAVHDPAPGGF